MEDEEYKVYGITEDNAGENKFILPLAIIVMMIFALWVVVGISRALI